MWRRQVKHDLRALKSISSVYSSCSDLVDMRRAEIIVEIGPGVVSGALQQEVLRGARAHLKSARHQHESRAQKSISSQQSESLGLADARRAETCVKISLQLANISLHDGRLRRRPV